ncbi:unnamed protein product [Caenorhabditis auriculariae]|uniref:Uncharacterized protein n=1 Tax=Caenorhabditis auriculariae TaxID=2777116 RepID=A0A8S1GYJ6_9PELO|nr:unnamed protein product [Caenorhabditis auriculariae]
MGEVVENLSLRLLFVFLITDLILCFYIIIWPKRLLRGDRAPFLAFQIIAMFGTFVSMVYCFYFDRYKIMIFGAVVQTYCKPLLLAFYDVMVLVTLHVSVNCFRRYRTLLDPNDVIRDYNRHLICIYVVLLGLLIPDAFQTGFASSAFMGVHLSVDVGLFGLLTFVVFKIQSIIRQTPEREDRSVIITNTQLGLAQVFAPMTSLFLANFSYHLNTLFYPNDGLFTTTMVFYVLFPMVKSISIRVCRIGRHPGIKPVGFIPGSAAAPVIVAQPFPSVQPPNQMANLPPYPGFVPQK